MTASSAPSRLNPVKTFLVNKTALEQTKVDTGPAPAAEPLQNGQILVRIERFAFTANNVTYALAGDGIGYWRFFPAAEPWGVIPVWGFGTVRHSNNDVISEDERLFGFFPMATHFIMSPDNEQTGQITDGAAHRADLPAVYNTYLRVSRDPNHKRADEALQMLFRPLFMTAFLIEDFLADERYFGARSVLILSASSKTGIGVAQLMAMRGQTSVAVTGLTSPSNEGFLKGLGIYDRVVTYDKVPKGLPPGPVAIVDMAGNMELLQSLYDHYGNDVVHTCQVGASHGRIEAAPDVLPGAKPKFFFAPERLRKRAADWGPGGVEARFAKIWRPMVEGVGAHVHIREQFGEDAVRQVYLDTLSGKASPDEGHILSLLSESASSY